MIHKYTSYGKTKTYKIPNIPQIGDYRYAKDLTCSCSIFDSFDKQLKNGIVMAYMIAILEF